MQTSRFDAPSTRIANHVDTEDLYLLASGLDYPRALGDWASVGGAPSLPPLAALGIWYSRYFPYGEESYQNIIVDNYTKYGLPLSVGVLDVPWHNINYAVSDLGPDKHGTAPPGRGCNGWDGFTFNRTLFPDLKRAFDQLHGEGIKMILSVHMQNGIDHCQEQYVNTQATPLRPPHWPQYDLEGLGLRNCLALLSSPQWQQRWVTQQSASPPTGRSTVPWTTNHTLRISSSTSSTPSPSKELPTIGG